MTKKELRALMRGCEREFLETGCADELSAIIASQLESFPEFAQAHTVLCYMAMPGEVDLSSIISKFSGTKRFVIPLVRGDELELREYVPEMTVPGYKGIIEPSEDAPAVNPSEIEFAIVPGVAFSIEDGAVRRMGHGKGFYDRLIPALNCVKVGICFPFRIVDSLPADPWDMSLDSLVSL